MTGPGPRIGRARRKAAAIRLVGQSIDEDAVPGAVIGALSVRRGGAVPWVVTLPDGASGMFALSGLDLVVGSTPLSHAATPAPVVLARADNGLRVVETAFAISVRLSAAALLDEDDAPLVDEGDLTITGA